MQPRKIEGLLLCLLVGAEKNPSSVINGKIWCEFIVKEENLVTSMSSARKQLIVHVRLLRSFSVHSSAAAAAAAAVSFNCL